MMLRITALLTVLVMLAGCSTSPTGRSQLVLMPDSQMNQMGLQAFTTLKKKTPVDSSRTSNNYVQCVANAITREVGGNWEVAVFKDDSANAFALPGNKIGVHTGMLQVAKNQHQLAAVIGHEVAHVLSRHSNERVSQKFAVEQGLSLVNAVASPQSGTGQAVMGMLGVGAQFGILMPFSRVQESEADTYGLKLMARAGFDPRESVNLWINMGKTNKGQPPEFLSTHPSHSTRISDLRRNMDANMRIYQQAQNAGKRPACR
ncbi:MAG: M48 family metallopeptidase [Halobacteria archaeon]|nr:M48 family metallopeptidase [Halobacteria archaeon]